MVEPEAPALLGRHSPRSTPLTYRVTKPKYKKYSTGCKGIYKYLRDKPIHLLTRREFRLVLRLLLRTARPVLVTGRYVSKAVTIGGVEYGGECQ